MGIIPQEVVIPHHDDTSGVLDFIPNAPKDCSKRIMNGARKLGYVPFVVKSGSDGMPCTVEIYEKGPDGHKKKYPVFRGTYAADGGFAFAIELDYKRNDADTILKDLYGLVDPLKGGK
jgi:hypothetical protein